MGKLSAADQEDLLSGFKETLDSVFDYYRKQGMNVTMMAGTTLQWSLLSLFLNTMRDGHMEEREDKVRAIVDREFMSMLELVDIAINVAETTEDEEDDEHSEG